MAYSFDNVNYTYYSSEMGRAVIPSSDDFNLFKLENVQLMKKWIDNSLVYQLEDDGIDKAVCLMIETDYVDSQLLNGKSDSAVASESLNGHSVSYGSNARTKLEDLNAKSTLDRKIEKVKLFCDFNLIVR